MAIIIVVRVPGWRTFVFHWPGFPQLLHDAVATLRRRGRPSIFFEIETGSDASVLRLATPHGLVKWRGQWGESALCAAITNGRSDLACRLLKIGGTRPGDGSLATAAMCGDLAVVRALLAEGKSPNETLPGPQDNGFTPLMWATNRYHLEIMEALLDAGADVNAIAKDGSTAPLLTRVGNPKDLSALQLLCRYRPDITIKDWRGRSLIREAIDRERCGGQPEMRMLLQRHFPEVVFDASA